MDKKELHPGLFDEFPPVTTAEWEALIFADLKGADYAKRLIWKTYDGIQVKPYYREEDLENLTCPGSMPGSFPFDRGNSESGNDWEIRQDIPYRDLRKCNKTAIEFIRRGANGISFNASEINNKSDLELLLKDIDLTAAKIHFRSAHSYPRLVKDLAELAESGTIDGSCLKGSLDFDPLGYFMLKGDFYQTREHNFMEAVSLLEISAKYFPGLKVIHVNGEHFHNSGASIVQELAFTLAAGVEYLAGLTDFGKTIDDIASSMHFSLACGPDYFLQIAKIRSIRPLWARISQAFHPLNEASSRMFVHSRTSRYNKTVFDPYVNILRTATESMSAAIGGSDAITIEPFDNRYKDPDDFSLRIARNQQIILKEEAWLDKVADPAAGSYYIENLGEALSGAAWKLFLDVEEKGGFIKCFENGFIQEEIEKVSQQKKSDLANRKTVLLGTNQYPNPLEKIPSDLPDKELKSSAPALGCKPLIAYHLPGEFEEIRLATLRHQSKTGKQPSVFLLTMGNLAMRRARAAFAINFFGCAGYHVIDTTGFEGIDEGIAEYMAARADILVICSSDEEYPEIVPGICHKLKSLTKPPLLVVAGYPKEQAEEFLQAGVDEFIHTRSNLVETLLHFQEKLGITC